MAILLTGLSNLCASPTDSGKKRTKEPETNQVQKAQMRFGLGLGKSFRISPNNESNPLDAKTSLWSVQLNVELLSASKRFVLGSSLRYKSVTQKIYDPSSMIADYDVQSDSNVLSINRNILSLPVYASYRSPIIRNSYRLFVSMGTEFDFTLSQSAQIDFQDLSTGLVRDQPKVVKVKENYNSIDPIFAVGFERSINCQKILRASVQQRMNKQQFTNNRNSLGQNLEFHIGLIF